MLFRVKKDLKWNERGYHQGDVIDIPEGNPRIEGLRIGGFIFYDASETPPTEPVEIPVTIVNRQNKTKSRAKARRVGV